MRRSSRHVIRRQKQLAALVSGVRQEIVDLLAQMGDASVAQLAGSLGRPADALYFHIRALKKAGLVESAGYRHFARRKEALFRTVSPQLWLQYDPHSSVNRASVNAIVRSMLRLGIRDFTRAFQPGPLIVDGPRRELWALRKTGRLSARQVAEVNQLIERLTRSVSRPGSKGRLYAITILLTPLDRRIRRGAAGSKGVPTI